MIYSAINFDTAPVPSTIGCAASYVVYGQDIWSAPYSTDRTTLPDRTRIEDLADAAASAEAMLIWDIEEDAWPFDTVWTDQTVAQMQLARRRMTWILRVASEKHPHLRQAFYSYIPVGIAENNYTNIENVIAQSKSMFYNRSSGGLITSPGIMHLVDCLCPSLYYASPFQNWAAFMTRTQNMLAFCRKFGKRVIPFITPHDYKTGAADGSTYISGSQFAELLALDPLTVDGFVVWTEPTSKHGQDWNAADDWAVALDAHVTAMAASPIWTEDL